MVQTTTAQKTKAKARYLKAKRDRRKKRIKAASTSANAPTRARDVHAGSESSSDDDEEEITKVAGLYKRQEHELQTERTPERTKKGKHKHKKRTPSPPGSETDEPMQDRATSHSPIPQPPPASPPSLPALPSFPLPTQPAPPSKTTLALQGLDRAILEAEVIDPASSAPVPRPGSPSSTCPELDDHMRERLVELGVESLFAVQTVLLPFLLSNRALHCPYDPPQDACVSAPTGSGKTLAYVVPVTQILSARIVTRLRALVVLPTRDLVVQVRETFEAVAKGRGLKIAVATGQHSFAHEQSQLIHALPSLTSSAPVYHSKVDVLICTPGRLTDHLRGTPGFTLEHLRFLVIDEADRLITQSFQDWLAHVLDATQPPPSDFPPTELDEPQASSCQKLLFSATLTHDPSKIVPLGLRDPRYFVVGEQASAGAVEETFAFPTTLSEHMCVCSPADKPLVFFHLVHTHGVRNALVFTKSAESTAKLVQLFEFFEAARGTKETSAKPVVMQAYSSDLSGAERKNVIDSFRQGGIDLLVCSDLVARGVDISHVTHVVSYDVPVDMRKYVHRVGRTARAGRAGDAWSLVEDQEARYFKQMLRNAGHLDVVKKLKVKEKDLTESREYYEASARLVALRDLRNLYARTAD
ncbi:ATP-dependent RNA helicase dbp6 [Ceratobasidium sp. 392]|nr:ATP-dependent RNA helicase dbp6 [Ceratobasidium sp. 392]